MEQHLQYLGAKRRMSKAGIMSCAMGILVVSYFLSVAHFGLPVRASTRMRWLMVGPFYFVAIFGLVLGVVAIVRQRQLWWLGIPGFLLSGFPLAVIAFVLYRRYR